MNDRLAAERRIMLIDNLMNLPAVEMIKAAGRDNAASKAENSTDSPSFVQIFSDEQMKCPYGHLAKDGMIQYNGVTFMCDPGTNSICLGDMSDPKKVLNVNLPSGGCLKININNFGDISRAVGMFSPEDLNAIMRAISQYNHCTRKLEEIEQEESKVMDAADNNDKESADNIKKEDDWRRMDDEQWDKLIGQLDKYIAACKEELERREEIQEEAAIKAMGAAPADMRAGAASRAMLNAMANGFAGDMISKSQELSLTGDTSVGISEIENVKECASVTEDADKKVWTITAFGQDGIICKQCTMDGESKELWRLDYKNAGDAEKVWGFLDRFDKDADLEFAVSKEFWEDFLAGNISGDKLRASHEAAFEYVGPNAPESVKKAWMEAAEKVGVNGLGVKENGMLSHITELDIQRFMQWSKGQYDTDILGTTVESAISAIKKAIDAMDHPLTPNTQRTEEVRKARVKEREFYVEFLDRLEAIQLVKQ